MTARSVLFIVWSSKNAYKILLTRLCDPGLFFFGSRRFKVGKAMRQGSTENKRLTTTQKGSILLACAALSVSGCLFGGPSRLKAPSFDPDGAAEAAMGMYDTNQDGQLDEEELKSCAALGKAIEEIDKNGDGNLDQAEIEERIAFFAGTRTARSSLACRVIRKKRPVVGATVRFVPEEFMSDILVEASGTTNEVGMTTIHIQDQMGGIVPGFYKVEISKKSKSGKESLPEQYNTKTTLGQEVTDGSQALATGLVFELR